MTEAVQSKDLVIAATGRKSLGSKTLAAMAPNTPVVNASSLDYELRSPNEHQGGMWGAGWYPMEIHIGPKKRGAPSRRATAPSGSGLMGKIYADAFSDRVERLGLSVEFRSPEVVSGGFVIRFDPFVAGRASPSPAAGECFR